ncbi:MAG: ATP-binding protein [Lachnospiraceae bacterium]|nr:ATP-binding protein [Lachnospiraceae bacterium]
MENNLVTVKEMKDLSILNNGLLTADKFINKNYLINVADNEVVPLNDSEKNIDAIRLFKVDKLVYDNKENVNDKLISVYSALQNVDSSALLVVDGNKNNITFYIGIRSQSNASTASMILEKSFIGNFPGSTLRSMKKGEINEVMESVSKTDYHNTSRNVSCVTVIPSMRDDDKEKFVQGIEKFIDTMKGEKYTAVFIAEPISKEALEMKKRGFEEMYSSISPFAKTSLAYGENYSKAVSNGMFENFSHSVNNSVANTTGTNSSINSSNTYGTNKGHSYGFGGFGSNSGKSSSKTSGYSSGTNWSKAVTEGTADTTGTGTNTSDTETKGDSRTLTIEHQNKSVSMLLDKIDEQLERIRSCEAFGVWECAGYFIADDIQTSVVAANTYKALMLGDDTDVENSFVNVWGINNADNTKKVLEYIQYGQHPFIKITPENGFESQYVTPGNYISGKELPLLMGLPHKSVAGLTVSNIAEFGRNVFVQNERPNQKKIRLGNVFHMGNVEDTIVKLDLNSLTSHCFIAGATGSGKSNTSYVLLEKLIENDTKFLVVEPAKGEYKEAFGNLAGINVYTTNPLIGQMLKINPFRFDKNIHILEHLERLIEIFNACWEMYAAMPAILKDAVERIYIEKGWDLLNSVYLKEGEPDYPTFKDLMRVLPNIINSSGYSSDTKGDYTGALVTRVTSLTNGISGQIFCDNYDIPDSEMFDENTIVDLSRVGSSETKSLIMGLLVLKLSEYRMANANQANSELKHVTILEEAHNLLKRVTPGTSGSNIVGKSVEMICNSIAEMRTYGEGFVIIDQSPTAVDIAAIKNTNTKIVMRLPEKEDCATVGNATGLNEDQICEVSKLPTGVAVVMQNNWLESVLTKIDSFSNKYEKKLSAADFASIRKLKGLIIQHLMQQYIVDKQMNLERILEIIDNSDVNIYKKREYSCCVSNVVNRLQKKRDIDTFCEALMNISGTKNLFDIMEGIIKKAETTSDTKYEPVTVETWKKKFREELKKYVDLPDNFNNTLVKYLLHVKEKEQGNIDYIEVYKMLY